MADPVSYGHPERDIEQALITLKKGTQLVKYSRKGKPKFRAFRVSPDETALVWYSHGDERNLNLSSVLRIIPGQRTAVFRRYLRPEKEYLSFSLIYNNGERSLDLICKDKVEAEVWFAGLKALIGKGRNRRNKSDISDVYSSEFIQNGRSFGGSLEYTSSLARGRVSVDLATRDSSVTFASSAVAGSEYANMQLRTSTGDGFRVSVSSTPSCSSGGSGPDDIESLGDVYVWGEVWSDGMSDSSVSSIPTKIDVLTPKPLETNVVLDVQQIACGVRHVALVTRQGEVFTWGEESGGRLGHGIEKDFSHPRLVEFLAVINVDYVACGEYHTCAISTSGDLFTWGDGTHNAGLLGHGSDVSHWIPKRVSGPLEGLQVLSIACGSWHSALVTSNGKLFTFGDGAFGVLGHGNRESVSCPKEVQFSGWKTIKVACGIWHTAAIIEVPSQSGANIIPSRKLFTWGDGDKYRLGHGNKDSYLFPTCVSPLTDYNFHQLACGNTMTVALTTSGHVFTMGSPENGQLGNPIADGKVPCLVQDKLVGEFVEEIACGAHHVAVLTSRSEVLTWGRGANGRLGHGDTEDRKSPTIVETLKDRHAKNIACGSNFTSIICIHKWVSGADQSVCSGCRQAFGFTRKRHNCYNCGLVHCHACSSKKALRAALAPTPGKPHRVCDACYAKLKAGESGSVSNINRKATAPRQSIDTRERSDRGAVRSSRTLLSPTTEPVRYLEVKTGKFGANSDSPSMVRASQVPSNQQLKDISFPSSTSALQSVWKPAVTQPPQRAASPTPQPTSNSRPASPYSRRPSPPRSSVSGFSRGIVDSLKKSNDVLHQEVAKLHNQIRTMKQKCDDQDTEIKKLHRNAQDAASLAAAGFSRCREAMDILRSIVKQSRLMTEKLPPDVQESETFKAMSAQAEAFLTTNETTKDSSSLNPPGSEPEQQNALDTNSVVNKSSNIQEQRMEVHVDSTEANDTSHGSRHASGTNGAASHQSSENDCKSTGDVTMRSEGETEIIEQFEPGVYVTFVQRRNGTRSFRRVRFSKRRFAAQQAEEWWNNNKERVLKTYNTQVPTTAPVGSSPCAEEGESSSQEMPSSKPESSSES